MKGKPHHSQRKEDLTAILNQLDDGDEVVANQLVPIVYDELRRIAHNKLRFERGNHTLNTTALVHEAYLKMNRKEGKTWQSRVHFMAVASTVMRHILINYAEMKRAVKRGSGATHVSIDDVPIAIDDERAEELIALDEALKKLNAFDENGAKMVEYRFFGGLTQKEIAEVMGISERTVRRHWIVAKSWIKREVMQDV